MKGDEKRGYIFRLILEDITKPLMTYTEDILNKYIVKVLTTYVYTLIGPSLASN
jgi:hypothetical protein